MTDSRRKVLLVIPGLTAGGAERVLVLLAGGLLARGHRVEVVTTFGRQQDFYRLPQGVGRVALDLAGETSRLADKLAGNLRRIAGLRRAIRAAAPDVVISFLSETNVLVLLATMGLGVPVIVTEHTDPRRYPSGRAWKVLRRLSYRRASRLVSPSAGVDRGFSWLPSARRVVIHNPVRLDEDDKAAVAPLGFPWPHTVLAMGRLESEKGFDLLIDAFGRLAADFPDWGLAILGEGSLRQKLSAQIANLGLDDRIRLPGVMDSAATLRRGELFVLSSRHEAFGLALAEAMAAGLPVVAADCPSGPAEIIHCGEDGLLVPGENAAALAGAVAQLMADPAQRRRLGQNARAAVRRFELSTVIQSWEQVIDDCLR
jgi:glycosyltransferase involved in cell wall biosynthesis